MTGDHSTPMKRVDHSYEAVPFTIATASNMLGENQGESERENSLRSLMDDVTIYDEL